MFNFLKIKNIINNNIFYSLSFSESSFTYHLFLFVIYLHSSHFFFSFYFFFIRSICFVIWKTKCSHIYKPNGFVVRNCSIWNIYNSRSTVGIRTLLFLNFTMTNTCISNNLHNIFSWWRIMVTTTRSTFFSFENILSYVFFIRRLLLL